MKKPLTMSDEPQPRNITRADLVLTEGFGLEVDGRMKTVFPTLQAAVPVVNPIGLTTEAESRNPSVP